jgi:DNA-binding MarR family transcriptional regulator
MTRREQVAASDYPLGPALEFLRRLWRLDQAPERLSTRMEKRLGVTAQQRLIVRCLGKYPGLTAGHLANLLHVDPGTVSVSLKRLERKGLLKRHVDPRDQRRVSLGLTAKGRAVDRPAQGTLEDAVERLLERTPEADLASMATILEQLTGLLTDAADPD